MNELRRTRHHAVYEWQEDDDPEEIDPARLTEVVQQLFTLAYDCLRRERPAIAADLVIPEGA